VDTSAGEIRLVASYAGLAFTLGLAWFVLAPVVPAVSGTFHIALGAALLLISLYGYAMIVGSLPAGIWAARRGPGPALRIAILLTAAGLFVRAIAPTYSVLVVGQVLAALAYPFLIAPIGSVLRVAGVRRLKTGTGLVIGTLFFGMAVGALLGGRLPLAVDLWGSLLVNVLSGLWLWDTLPHLPAGRPVDLGPLRLVTSGWWLIGFVVASLTVMMGSVSSAALSHLHVSHGVELGGSLAALIFLGSALGAVVLGPVGQHWSDTRRIQNVMGVATLVFVCLGAALLTGSLPAGRTVFTDLTFFLLGAFGNGWYALALDAAAQEAADAGSAGLATAGYSLASNVGVAVVPTLLGPLVVSAAPAWFLITGLLALGAAAIPFVIRIKADVAEPAGAGPS
jgi:DHA1 family inner membrane transport protein